MPPSASLSIKVDALTERRRSAALWLLTAALLVLTVTTIWTAARLSLVTSLASKQFEDLRYRLEMHTQIDITAEPYLAFDPTTAVREPLPVQFTGALILAALIIAAMLCLLKWR